VHDEIGTQWKKGQLIGRGSYGSVYMVLNESNGKFMAMKEVELGFKGDADEVRALVGEIQLLQQLEHPNIVRYLGSRIQPSSSCIQIFTEWVPGGSIRSILDNFGPLSPNVVRSYVHQSVEGLLYLHDHHIWHRDIKGANILVDHAGIIKLADFGTSEKLRKKSDGSSVAIEQSQSSSTSEGVQTTCGTPLFMAPEAMLDPKTVDGLKADIWSLGATTLQMITGSPPWREHGFSNFMQLMMFVARDDSSPLIDDGVPPAIRDFIGQCFRRNPNIRPSARQLLTHPFFGKSSMSHGRNSIKSVHSTKSTTSTISTTAATSPRVLVVESSRSSNRNSNSNSNRILLPPMSVDQPLQEYSRENAVATMPSPSKHREENLKVMDDTNGYQQIQSFLEETARDSHSEFHRSSSIEADNDSTMLETGDMALMSSIVSEYEGTNPFGTHGECEDLTSTAIVKKTSTE